MRRTEEALAAWREAGRELDRAAEALLMDPESAETRTAYEEAARREEAARLDYQANVNRVAAERVGS